MPSQRSLKLAVRLAGYAIVAFSLWYLADALGDHYRTLVSFDWDSGAWSVLIVGALLYAAFLLLLVLSWAIMLFGGLPNREQALTVFAVYGRSSIGKYLPGNVFHFVGRQLMGRSLGIEQLRLGLASLAEVGFSVLSAALFAAAVFSFPQSSSPLLSPGLSRWLLVLLLLATGMAFIALRPRAGLFTRLPAGLARLGARLAAMPLLTAFILNLLFFSGVGAVAAGSFGLLSDMEQNLPRIAAIYLAAWAIGYVVPGASGGLGVREAVLVAQLAPITGEAFALAFAIFMRFQTVLADVLLFAVALVVPGRNAATS